MYTKVNKLDKAECAVSKSASALWTMDKLGNANYRTALDLVT